VLDDPDLGFPAGFDETRPDEGLAVPPELPPEPDEGRDPADAWRDRGSFDEVDRPLPDREPEDVDPEPDRELDGPAPEPDRAPEDPAPALDREPEDPAPDRPGTDPAFPDEPLFPDEPGFPDDGRPEPPVGPPLRGLPELDCDDVDFAPPPPRPPAPPAPPPEPPEEPRDPPEPPEEPREDPPEALLSLITFPLDRVSLPGFRQGQSPCAPLSALDAGITQKGPPHWGGPF
jgi:hypothetical protein